MKSLSKEMFLHIDRSKSVYNKHHLRAAPFNIFPPAIDETRNATGDNNYFCYWYPKLFGIDEDEIPDSENEEGIFDIDWSDLQDRALELTDSELDRIRVGSRACLSDEELREAWLRTQHPKYGRRARQKPILHRENGEPFECICDIDLHFYRHYIPNFGGGVAKEGEELKTPHFKAFWEDMKDRQQMGDLARVSKIFNVEEPAKEEYSGKPVFHFLGLKKSNIQKFRANLLDTFRPLHCREVRRQVKKR